MKAEKRLLLFFHALVLTLSISGCGKQSVSESSAGKVESTESSVAHQSDHKQEEANVNVSSADGNEAAHETIQTDKWEETESMLLMKIGNTEVTVEWEDNASVQALRDLCSDAPLTIQMSMYGGFEQVGSIGTSLPRNDQQTTTGVGDIVLYSGNQIVVFYGSNSWAYTRLGHITDQDAAGMAELLGNGDVTLTLSA